MSPEPNTRPHHLGTDHSRCRACPYPTRARSGSRRRSTVSPSDRRRLASPGRTFSMSADRTFQTASLPGRTPTRPAPAFCLRVRRRRRRQWQPVPAGTRCVAVSSCSIVCGSLSDHCHYPDQPAGLRQAGRTGASEAGNPPLDVRQELGAGRRHRISGDGRNERCPMRKSCRATSTYHRL